MKKENKATAMDFMHAFAAAHGAKIEKKKDNYRIIIPANSCRCEFQHLMIDVIDGLTERGVKLHNKFHYDEKHKSYELSNHFKIRIRHYPPHSKELAYFLEFS